MLKYYSRLALLSFRRNIVLTILMVLAIGLGVAMTMTAFTVLYVMSRDPIPEKSAVLFAVQIDNGGPRSRKADDPEPPTQLAWRDAFALLSSHAASRQAAMYQVGLTVIPDNPGLKPFATAGRATTRDFFAMFQVPFLFGSAWTASDDASGAPNVVISKRLNEKMFGGENSVGRTLKFNNATYHVVGVIDDWDPKPRFYDVIGGMNFEEGEDVYIPLKTAIDREMSTSEYEFCDAGPRGDTFADLLRSECVWLQYWVELRTSDDVQRYRDFLVNYSRDQQRAGRFGWDPNIRLRNVRDWLVAQKVVPDDAKLSVLVAFSFFITCLVSALGLMLAKAFGRAGEFGVRRALGASAGAIFSQALVEAGVLGLLGGLLGLGLTSLGLHLLRDLFPASMGRIAQMDGFLFIATVLFALIATVCAGIYPAWRSMRVAPALQLKGG